LRRPRFLFHRWQQIVARWETLVGLLQTEKSPAGVLLRMLIPGWTQFYVGKVRRGLWFLSLYLAFLLVGALFWGTIFGSIMLGLALTTHLSSIVDIVFSYSEPGVPRIAWILLCWLAIGIVFYWPAGWAVSHLVIPQRIVWDAPPFREGDVILYHPSAYAFSDPAVGDVVLYRIPPTRVTVRTGVGAGVYDIQGMRIDRIIAGPGQFVRWNGKELQVDGQPSPWLPLNPSRLPVSLEFQVPPRHYAVLPSTDPIASQVAQTEVWRAISLLERRNILGEVWVRHQPLSRFWIVR